MTVYIEQLTVCLTVANDDFLYTALSKTERRIAGWHEYVDPIREKMSFWHSIWEDCGRPRDGVVAGVMRRRRASYHYVHRGVRRREEDVKKERFADAVLQNKERDYWTDIKRMCVKGLC